VTTVATRQTTDLSISPDQETWTEKQKAALTQLGVKGASNADLAVFFHYAARTGLDPFARQLYMIQRAGKQTIQTGVDGFRLVARRAADQARETLSYGPVEWSGPEGQWQEVWLADTPPAAAKVTVYRAGQAFPAVVLWREFSQTTDTWKRMPAHMLAKVAEVAALRKAFPQDLSGLYSEDEPVEAASAPQAARVTAAEVVGPPAPVVVVEEPTAPVEDWPAVQLPIGDDTAGAES
jgi:phage recombination protein Bet